MTLAVILELLLSGGASISETIATLSEIGFIYKGLQTIGAVAQYINSLIGGGKVACANTHKTSTLVQGPGVCCAALTASGLTPAVGVRVAAVNKKGKCIICEVKLSTSKKAAPGQLAFKRGKAAVPGSAVSCPSTVEGCCALAAA